MENKDLLWVRPDYTPGKPTAEKATRKRERKPSKDETFIDDGKQASFTVAQIASLWQLSTDTIQRIFEDEAGVMVQGSKNPRGKRKRITLRIPREVMMRVKKRRSNPA
jgi:predicted DNA binding CopG/RHH family protein